MSEYNPVVINWAGRTKSAGLSLLIVNLGVPWALRINSPVLLRSCPKCVVVFFRRGLPHCPNVSNCMQIWMNFLYFTQNEMKLFEVLQNWIKLFEVTQNWMKMFHLTQIWMEQLQFRQSLFSLLEFTQTFPIY